MERFKDNVPFDPGYSKISFSFLEQISYLTEAYRTSKIPNQKKFHLARMEQSVVDLINKSTAFYLGCMLWGGFISNRFKDSPKDILGNNNLKLSAEAAKDLDCGEEAKIILEYIQSFDRDCKYFLKKPANISPRIPQILNNYIEFARLNNNFLTTKKTDEIKLPELVKTFEKLSDKELDEICDKIFKVIEEKKTENLLEI